MQYKIIILLICLYPASSLSHGVSGGSFSYEKKNTMEAVEQGPHVKDRFNFLLKIKKDNARLWVSSKVNEAIDSGLITAMVVVSDIGKPFYFTMEPTDKGYVHGTIPNALSGNAKLSITLRLPGELPIELLFEPMKKETPIQIVQQKLRQY